MKKKIHNEERDMMHGVWFWFTIVWAILYVVESDFVSSIMLLGSVAATVDSLRVLHADRHTVFIGARKYWVDNKPY